MTGALSPFDPRVQCLSANELLEAAYLWSEGRDTERVALALGRHESVIYNALDTIKNTARAAFSEAAE